MFFFGGGHLSLVPKTKTQDPRHDKDRQKQVIDKEKEKEKDKGTEAKTQKTQKTQKTREDNTKTKQNKTTPPFVYIFFFGGFFFGKLRVCFFRLARQKTTTKP
jgi:hypothetical protein